MMMAIAHGASVKDGGRGRPPKAIADKYTDPGKDAPESKHNDHGGNWDEAAHKRHHEKHSKKKKEEEHKKLSKAFEEFYKGKAAAAIVMDNNSRVLLGQHCHGGLAFPGGHCDAGDADHEMTALREMKEESGLVGANPQLVHTFKHDGNETQVFLIESWRGTPKSTEEIKNWKWYEPQDIPWEKLRDCCIEPLKKLVKEKMGKSLKGMLSVEKLEKNIIRQKGDAVFEVTHGDALRLVGNGMFRLLREATKGMGDEDFKDFKIDTHTVSIRRHASDIYSGRVNDGHKMVYQFTNKSLPELTAALMSVFEWYSPEDEKGLELLDDSALSDDAIKGGINSLLDNYKRHNIGNIYNEMETIREQMRDGMAVDLQQVEARIMKLFDKLENMVHDVATKHNKLGEMASKELDEVEEKLRGLQSRLDELDKKPEKVEAFSAKPADPKKVHDENYPYLPRPQVEISPNGKIVISFGAEWTPLEKQNFLTDMRAKSIKAGKSGEK